MRAESGLTLLELLIVLAIISILAMVGLPAYSDYMVRTKVIEDFTTVHNVQTLISEYYMLNARLPTKNSQLGLGNEKTITGVRLEKLKVEKNGKIKVHWDKKVALPVLGKQNSIDFIPTEKNGRLIWDCTGGSMLNKFRPPSCRG